MILFGEESLRKSTHEFVVHYHHERNHQGLGNRLVIREESRADSTGAIQRRQRLGGFFLSKLWAKAAQARLIWASASCQATPSRRRVITPKFVPEPSPSRLGWSGVYTSAFKGVVAPCCSTPTTVYGSPLSRIARPRTFGSEPKTLRQRLSLSMAALGPWGRSSSVEKLRPR